MNEDLIKAIQALGRIEGYLYKAIGLTTDDSKLANDVKLILDELLKERAK